jgi:hypothetical protein
MVNRNYHDPPLGRTENVLTFTIDKLITITKIKS